MPKLCIIPARGGSKRIPKKNIKDFLGKPIISYSIETALASGLFDEVMVSTDDQEIAEIAKQCGAKVPFFRSEENSNDHATTVSVILEVLQAYSLEGTQFDEVCCIYPTAPFVTAELLHESYQKLIDGNFDSVFPVMEFSFPIQRALRIKDGKIEAFSPQHILSRSQDLEKSYHDAGQFYWSKVSSLNLNKKLWTNNTSMIVIENMAGQDIDNPEDWILAEVKYKIKFLA